MIAREDISPAVAARILRLRGLFLAVLAGLAAYLFHLQVVRQDEFEEAAAMNSIRRLPLRAPRGFILDREGRVLVKNRPAFDAVILADRVERVEQTVRRAETVLRLPADRVERLRKALKPGGRAVVLVKEDLPLGEVAALEARAYEWPEFRIREGLVRSYPHGVAAAHALGHMGEISDQQLESGDYSGYGQGEVIGQTGVEARYERHLRGRDGYRRVVVNSRGREIKVLDQIEAPRPGLDLHLTLDLDVQLAAESAFGSQRGAAVAVDVSNGEILALVSRPAYDPNAFAGKVSAEDWSRYNHDPTHPLFDRALLGKLPPGSVFKVIDAIAGLEERTWDPDQRMSCGGSTVLHGDRFHCWKPGGHGSVGFHEAMRGSCNVYFYHRGDAIGIDKLAAWSHRLGLGEKSGIDIDPEGRGVVPDPAWKRRTRGEPWWAGETVSVAIGQGALGVSVLQVEQVMQLVANGGRAYVPYLVAAVGNGEIRRTPLVAREVPLRADTLKRLRSALAAVVNEPGGTGGRARIEGFSVSGKTGTAQTPPSSSDPADAKPHAWFAGFAPGDNPIAVAAVFVEHGGHGGDTAAPIARAMLARILEKRGLKPAEPAAEPVAALSSPAGPAPEAAEMTLTATTPALAADPPVTGEPARTVPERRAATARPGRGKSPRTRAGRGAGAPAVAVPGALPANGGGR